MATKPLNLPFLQGVGTALDKLVDAIEHDAQNFIEKEVQGVHSKKDAIFAKAKERTDGARESLGQIDVFLDALDKKLSGNILPTSGDLSQSPDQQNKLPPAANIAAPVSAQPAETAQLAETK